MSKSLGTLTLDLVARVGGFVEGLSKAERESSKYKKKVQKQMKEVREGFNTAAKSAGVMGAAVAAASAAMVVSTARSAAEITRLSAVAGTTTDQFQRYAAGAKTLGIEQEKLADIFKDTSDKVGDFLQTGGGPLADFFENIAPKIGVTAEQFRNLSGPQALELYVSSLEKANVSQNEMTFFMEAIASDATMLLPLLRNSSEGFNLLGQAADDAGSIMDSKTIAQTERLNAVLSILDMQSQGLKNQFVSGLMPTFTDLAVEVSEVAVKTGVAAEVGETFGTILKGVAASAAGAAGAVQILGKGIGAIAAVAGAIASGEFQRVREVFIEAREDINQTAEEYGSIIRTILDAGSGGDESAIQSKVDQIADLMRRSREAMDQGLGGGSTGGDPNAKLKDQLQGRIDALATSFMTEQQVLGEQFVEQQILLDEAFENKLLSEESYHQMSMANKQMYEDGITAIENQAAADRMGAAKNILGQLSTLMNGHSRKLFEVGKIAAIAGATISGIEATQDAFKWGMKIGGPPLAAAFAGASILATGARIQQIARTKFGGGSSGVSNTQSVSAGAAPAMTTQDQMPTRNVYFSGISPDEFYRGDMIIEAIDTELRNGGRFAGIIG